MKKKSILAILLTLIMCAALAGCGHGTDFNDLCDYVVKNGEVSTNENGIECYTMYISIVDSEYYEDIMLQVPVTNSDTYEKIYIAGVAKIELSNFNFGDVDDYIFLCVNSDGTFEVFDYWKSDTTHEYITREYGSDTESYTSEAVSQLSVGKYVPYCFNSFLNRLSVALSEIRFDLTSLGFTSFAADEAAVHDDYNFAKEFEAVHVNR